MYRTLTLTSREASTFLPLPFAYIPLPPFAPTPQVFAVDGVISPADQFCPSSWSLLAAQEGWQHSHVPVRSASAGVRSTQPAQLLLFCSSSPTPCPPTAAGRHQATGPTWRLTTSYIQMLKRKAPLEITSQALYQVTNRSLRTQEQVLNIQKKANSFSRVKEEIRMSLHSKDTQALVSEFPLRGGFMHYKAIFPSLVYKPIR